MITNLKYRSILLALTLITLLAGLCSPAAALTIKGVDLNDEIKVEDQTLYLNGAGIRKKFFISVYACGLYLPHPTGDAAKAISSNVSKQVVMHFIHSKVDREKIVKGWDEGFFNNSQERLPQLQDRISAFNAFFDRDLVAGDRLVLTYIPAKGTSVSLNNELRGLIEGEDFMQALWAIWLGDNPADKGMKEGMLGK